MKKVQGNDAFQRINFLYQISKQIVVENSVLSSYYGNLMNSIGKKNVLKIHPEIKRQICKKCRCTLINDVSATIKIKTINKQKFIKWSCKACGATRRLPASKDKDHRVWLEKCESVVQVVS